MEQEKIAPELVATLEHLCNEYGERGVYDVLTQHFGAQPTGIELWWRDTAITDLNGFLPKLLEYGANDLDAIGRDLLEMAGWEDQPDRVGAELGCIFYLRGKIARAMEAIANHRLPSEDTLLDITVYSMMARRIRQNGSLA